ncbi:hypothetical protein K435DRAFT_797760 [Dendrothele bispora CBS 962.96]|uniref:Uncharacterized protein n=1 Tax=Dendrothele bispora (strain CBS 962.96) TaxID=1314807 RepID=A0A4S8M2J7_DENBC|nr:hypothetical protein K435DRAFT_797760 [Dendrothele bispora CBS 962.96]
MQGTESCEVSLDGFWKQETIAEGGNPFKDASLRGWKVLARGFKELRVESHEVDIGFLPSGVGLASAGCKAMPEIECDPWREVRVRFIPVSWGSGEEEICVRCGPRENRREY